jgi:hypothetical protein
VVPPVSLPPLPVVAVEVLVPPLAELPPVDPVLLVLVLPPEIVLLLPPAPAPPALLELLLDFPALLDPPAEEDEPPLLLELPEVDEFPPDPPWLVLLLPVDPASLLELDPSFELEQAATANKDITAKEPRVERVRI